MQEFIVTQKSTHFDPYVHVLPFNLVSYQQNATCKKLRRRCLGIQVSIGTYGLVLAIQLRYHLVTPSMIIQH